MRRLWATGKNRSNLKIWEFENLKMRECNPKIFTMTVLDF